MKMEINKDMAEKIKKIMRKNNLSLEEFSERINYSPNYVKTIGLYNKISENFIERIKEKINLDQEDEKFLNSKLDEIEKEKKEKYFFQRTEEEKEIYKIIKNILKRENILMKEMAEKMGLSPTTISNFGRRGSLTKGICNKLFENFYLTEEEKNKLNENLNKKYKNIKERKERKKDSSVSKIIKKIMEKNNLSVEKISKLLSIDESVIQKILTNSKVSLNNEIFEKIKENFVLEKEEYEILKKKIVPEANEEIREIFLEISEREGKTFSEMSEDMAQKYNYLSCAIKLPIKRGLTFFKRVNETYSLNDKENLILVNDYIKYNHCLRIALAKLNADQIVAAFSMANEFEKLPKEKVKKIKKILEK